MKRPFDSGIGTWRWRLLVSANEKWMLRKYCLSILVALILNEIYENCHRHRHSPQRQVRNR